MRSSPGRLPAVTAIAPSRRAAAPRRSAAPALDRVETAPGLAAWGDAAAALSPLLAWAAAALPRRSHAATPALLLATAGVRKLPPLDRAALLADAASALAASPFAAAPPRVLAGEDEAAYAWAALNFRAGTLHQAAASRAPPVATIAVLDLGGSSLETAVAVERKERRGGAPTAAPPPLAASRHIVVGASSHDVAATSYPGLGLDDAWRGAERACGGGGAACAEAAQRAAAAVAPLPPNTRVAALSGFAVVAKTARLTDGASVDAWSAAAGRACADADAAADGEEAADGEADAMRPCFNAAYAASLLHRVAPASVSHRDGGGWPLGAALLDGLPLVARGGRGADTVRVALWAGAVAAAAVGGALAAAALVEGGGRRRDLAA